MICTKKKIFYSILFVTIVILITANINSVLSLCGKFTQKFVMPPILTALDNALELSRESEVGYDFNKISYGKNLVFEINHHKNNDSLEYADRENNKKYTLLTKVTSYKFFEENLFVLSRNGYAIIDESGLCRIAPSSTNQLTENYKCNDIKYLPNFEGYSKEEKTNFKNLKKEHFQSMASLKIINIFAVLLCGFLMFRQIKSKKEEK